MTSNNYWFHSEGEYIMNQKSKKDKIRNWLEEGRSITPKDAYEMFGSMRLASIIHDLKADGYTFNTEYVRKGNSKYAKYSLVIPSTLFGS